MKNIAILIPQGLTSISNIENTYIIFSHVNGILASKGQVPLFNVQLVGLNMPAAGDRTRFAAKPDVLYTDVEHTDLIIIPALIGNPDHCIALNREFIPWIKQQRQNGAEIASYCVGAFFLAATGLLNGKQCATHWFSANSFRQMFPEVSL
ncbi:MAG: DJ-1/PfpI family protein, partial [Mucilaginibacter sp.]